VDHPVLGTDGPPEEKEDWAITILENWELRRRRKKKRKWTRVDGRLIVWL